MFVSVPVVAKGCTGCTTSCTNITNARADLGKLTWGLIRMDVLYYESMGSLSYAAHEPKSVTVITSAALLVLNVVLDLGSIHKSASFPHDKS